MQQPLPYMSTAESWLPEQAGRLGVTVPQLWRELERAMEHPAQALAGHRRERPHPRLRPKDKRAARPALLALPTRR